MVTIQSQNFGVEIEMTGVSRGTAASVIANYFGVGGIHFAGGTYQTYEAKDSNFQRDTLLAVQAEAHIHQPPGHKAFQCSLNTSIRPKASSQSKKSAMMGQMSGVSSRR